jgi:hypothetical protein
MASRARRTGRWTDRVEDATAWILLAAGLLMILLGGVYGIAVHDRLTDQARAEALDRKPAVATLLNAAPTIGSDATLSMPVEVAATWRDRAGVPHTGTVPAPQGLEADTTVQIWIDRSGAAAPEPTSDGDALEMAIITAAITVLGGAVVLAALWRVVRRITLSCNCAAWEREWRDVAASWTRGEGRRS